MRLDLLRIATLCVSARAHEHFCRECADRAAALLINANASSTLLAKPDTTSPASLAALPFTLSEVTLTPDENSAEYVAQQTNLNYLLMLPVSSLAYNFRNTSKLPLRNATPFGGWEGPTGDDRGHFTGHYLSAAALMVNSTGNSVLRARSRELVGALAECQAANAKVYPRFGPGYLSGAPTIYFDCLENLWRRPCRYLQVPYYNVHKIMQGLLDQYELLGNEQAYQVVTGMAAYFYRRIEHVLAVNGTAVWEQILGTESGGMNDVMYKLYGHSGLQQHLTMAHLFDKPSWFDPMVAGSDVLAGKHANTHLALAVGGAQRYVTITDTSYQQATEFFYDTLQTAHSYSTGGSNFREFWQAAHEQGSTLLDVRSPPDQWAGHDNEESCTTYNFLKIVRHLFEWHAHAAMLEMYNYALTNGVLGIQRGTQPGVMLYLLPLGAGVTKGNSSRGWGTPLNSFWCCYGTGIESFSKLADSVYYTETATQALVVARYVSSYLRPKRQGGLALHQSASVARTGRATLVVDATPNTSTQLKLLIPSWAVAPSVTLNGAPTAAPAAASFCVLERVWRVGDTIELTLPAVVRLSKLDDSRAAYGSMYSFVFGDTLLVGLASATGAASAQLPIPSGVAPEAWVQTAVKRTTGELRFVVTGSDGVAVTLMPLNEVVDEAYSVYYNLTSASR